MEIVLPGVLLVSSMVYGGIVSIHGFLMLFMMVMPLLIGGFGNLLVPVMCWVVDMYLPRVNLMSLWLTVLAMVLMLVSFVLENGFCTG
jgi:heme/copper-type cytochrome/quinol oxidase subunit 1